MIGILDSYYILTDENAPEISNFDPVIGTAIGRTDPIQFVVTDDIEIAIVFIVVRYSTGIAECAYDGSSFHANYLSGSSRVDIDGGYRFTIRRTGGWSSTPITVDIIATDLCGNVGRGEFS